MHRRDFVAGLLCSAALPLGAVAFRASAQAGAEPINVVERFGFVADGRTDNYDAFHRWADHVNRVKGGHYVFPRGTYYVGKVRRHYHENRDRREIINSYIDQADGLTITGYGARIRLNGAFHRSARKGHGGEHVGRNMAIFMPFEFHRTRNLTIKGFEIDGGVREMSRDPEVWETYAALIALHGCTKVLLEDLDVHHCQTDGIYMTSSFMDTFLGGRPSLANRDVVIRNVKSHDNARGGLGVFHVYGLHVEDSAFNNNGRQGKYAPHAPQFGVDVEPDYVLPNVDVLTGNIEFRRCEFMGNISALLAGYADRYRGYFRVIDCNSAAAPEALYHMVFNWRGGLVQGGVHDIGSAVFNLSWQQQVGGDMTVRDCEIRCSGLYGVSHYFDGNLARLENVRIVGTQKEPGPHGELLLVRANPGGGRKNVIKNCEIVIPAARKAQANIYDYEVQLQHTLSQGNVYRTDLPATGGQHFAVGYGPGSAALGDRFRGTAPGPQDSIRPSHNSSHDTRLPFSTG